MKGAQAYARTQKQTASKERLMVLLFEAALKHMLAGAAALEAGNHGEGSASLLKASDIVLELSASLDMDRAPELGQTLKDLYIFVNARLMKASATRETGPAREAVRVFSPIVDAFSQAVSQLGATP